ncbi:MAG: hypothetical protein GKR94_00065 [Gammaproteobacteria bacterium]|nr:hypothetical protein [Gammaproteobacteria bacterium]
MRTLSLLVLAAVMALSGCGFQLRGQAELPSDMRVLGVRAANADVRNELAIYLQSSGVKVVNAETAANTDAVLIVGAENFSRRVLSIDPNTGKAREFELAYTFEYSVVGRDGETVVVPQSVRLVRDLVFDEDAVIGKSREEGVLRKEMRRDAIEQLIRRLQVSLRS